MQAWWSQLTMMQQILYYMAIPATMAIFIQTAMTFVGMGSDGDMDVDGDMDGEFDGDFEVSFQIFTVRNFIAFFAFFGWGGLWMTNDPNSSSFKIILVGTICGVLAMGISGGLFYFMKKMTSSGTLNMKNAIGKKGNVYIPIPKSRSGSGKIQINVQGAFRELEAMTDSEEALTTGTLIEVTGLVNGGVVLVQSSNK